MSAQQRAEAAQADWREFVIEALIRCWAFQPLACPAHFPLPASRRRADLLQGAASNLFGPIGIRLLISSGLPLLLVQPWLRRRILIACPGVTTPSLWRGGARLGSRNSKAVIECWQASPPWCWFFWHACGRSVIRETLRSPRALRCYRRSDPGLHGASHIISVPKTLGCGPEKLP